ncbi:hypothetical protein RvY_09096 [Ramazzottius varieornatus]|uniref:Palmitoyltransferase n=1 Tax=Ramazzottius varieornatus TaxID=947166 RepID=A0A1D1VAF8_RAMVA|nr:hypothetical protein RvY_09096 [Ramazzottius varieornatus]
MQMESRNGGTEPQNPASPNPANPALNYPRRGTSVTVPVTRRFPSDAKKIWQIFPGRTKFYCGGRLQLSHQYGIFVLTLVLIVATTVLFFVFDCPYLVANVSIAFPIVGGILFAFTFSTLMKTAFTDPGIMPRSLHDEQEFWDSRLSYFIADSIAHPGDSQNTANRNVARYLDVTMKEHTLKLKWCHTCKLFRPPRSSHCSICDNCIDHFDHHCPWVGNCVGKRNYRFFYMFIVSLSFLAVFIFGCDVAHLVLRSQTNGFVETIRQTPASLIEAIVCFLSLWSLLGLVGYHTYLISVNMTTNEDIKGGFPAADQSAAKLFSHGSMFKNFFVTLCGPRPASLIDPTGKINPATLAILQSSSVRSQSPAASGQIPNNSQASSNPQVQVSPSGTNSAAVGASRDLIPRTAGT